MRVSSTTRAMWLAVALSLIVASAGAQSIERIRKLYPATTRCCIYDAAHLLSSGDSAQIDGELKRLKDSTGFNVAVVTLSTIGDANPNDVALQIGRDWGVGSAGDVVDPQHARGMVIVVVPKTAEQRGQIATQLARGAEGIFTDATIGEIRRRGLDDFRAGNYGAGLEKIVAGIEPAIRASAPAKPRIENSDEMLRARAGPDIGPIVIAVVFVLFLGLGILIIVRAVRRGRRAPRDDKQRRLDDPTSTASSFAWFDSSTSSSSSSDSSSSSSDSGSSFDGGGDYGGGGGSDSF